MRVAVLSLFLSMVLLVPKVGNAQAFSRPTPDPIVTAENSPWQQLAEPIFYAGNFYFPAGPMVFFDGNVMVRTGHYEGVPLYSDTTIGPYSIVLVPIGGNLMRPYERRREGELAGSVGSRTPSFPVETNPDVITVPAFALASGGAVATGTSGVFGTAGAAAATYTPMNLQSIPPPTSNAGVWIAYDGERWYLAGTSTRYDPVRFTPVGSYRGFPVYQAAGNTNTIYVSVIQDGPIVPYERR